MEKEIICPVVQGNCIKDKCLAFQTERVRSTEEMKGYNASDMRVERVAKGNYCFHYKLRFLPSYSEIDGKIEKVGESAIHW